MRKLKSALLYTALAIVANGAAAESGDMGGFNPEDLPKLVWHAEPYAPSDVPFMTEDGAEITLTEYSGKYILVNFWATWCVPCRTEMPSLSALQTEMGGDDFEVVTIATGRNPRPAIDRFFDEIGVTNLPKHIDNNMRLARSMRVMGLPVSVILDREGREIARLTGEEHWDQDAVYNMVRSLTE